MNQFYNVLENLLTKEQIAKKFNVKLRTVNGWNLPEPDLILVTKKFWHIETINQWEQQVLSNNVSKYK